MANLYICNGVEDNCKNCGHSKPHEKFIVDEDVYCTKKGWCAFMEADVKCVKAPISTPDKTK